MHDVFEQMRDQAADRLRQLTRILRRRSHYRAVFNNHSGQAVLADLARFCRANNSSVMISPQTGMIDTHAMAVNEGKREVWLRIQTHLNYDEAKLAALKENIDE
jgi:hypothetical protein